MIDIADAPSDLAPPVAAPGPGCSRIVLTGFMGAGKTTIGRLLAEQLNWTFLDLDHAVEKSTGRSIPEIFQNSGEPALRRLESRALASALGRPHVVLALGGGAPETLTNRLLLEQTPCTVIVSLHAPFAVLYERCMRQALDPSSVTRPLLADRAEAERRFLHRQALYARLAAHRVDVSGNSPEQTATHVLRLLGSIPSVTETPTNSLPR